MCIPYSCMHLCSGKTLTPMPLLTWVKSCQHPLVQATAANTSSNSHAGYCILGPGQTDLPSELTTGSLQRRKAPSFSRKISKVPDAGLGWEHKPLCVVSWPLPPAAVPAGLPRPPASPPPQEGSEDPGPQEGFSALQPAGPALPQPRGIMGLEASGGMCGVLEDR